MFPPGPVVAPGEFVFASAFLEHGHIFEQTSGLSRAGGTLKWIYDPDPSKMAVMLARHPQARLARSFEEILDDEEVRMVAAAAIPCDRSAIGCQVMEAGKDYFTDKAPFTSLGQLAEAREANRRTGRKYLVYYSERLNSECAIFAGQLIRENAIGRVVQVLGLGPHRLGTSARPAWFFDRLKFGGILCDLGSHQVEQFLFYTGSSEARVVHARVRNTHVPEHPGFEDFGEASLVGEHGASGYFRVDWLTPAGLRTWGDGRLFILGTEGYIELRKYVDVTRQPGDPDNVILVNQDGEQFINVKGKTGFPFFGELILDSMHRTENAMTQSHAFKAAEICLLAQQTCRRRLTSPANDSTAGKTGRSGL